jgi:hypothetical protein
MIIALLSISIFVGCRQSKYDIYVRPDSEVRVGDTAQIGVKITNPVSGLHFRWSAVQGRCNPQESSNISTTYTAPLIPGEDHVTLEVFSGEKAIYEDEVLIRVVAGPAAEVRETNESQTDIPDPSVSPTTSPVEPSRPPNPWSASASGNHLIRITQVPHRDPVGGDQSSEDIAGDVSVDAPRNCRVVIYARTDKWYVQPLIAAPYTEIQDNKQWSTWTHTGTQYAALLVTHTYKPPNTLSVLPRVGGDVIDIAKEDGR